MAGTNSEAAAELMRMQERLRTLRDQLCEPKNNQNPRYHALSAAVSQLERAIADLEAESGPDLLLAENAPPYFAHTRRGAARTTAALRTSRMSGLSGCADVSVHDVDFARDLVTAAQQFLVKTQLRLLAGEQASGSLGAGESAGELGERGCVGARTEGRPVE